MRDLPPGLAGRLSAGAAGLCHAWIVTLSDGRQRGFTDHDRSLRVAGVDCAPESGLSAGAASLGADTLAGEASVEAVLEDDTDPAAGAWDGARIAHWRVDWTDPDQAVLIGRGTVQRVRTEGRRLVCEIAGPLQALDRVAGRTYGRLCDATLGDHRCGLEADAIAGRRCDKRFQTCRTVFGNALNFRGFPDIPGDDFLAAMPREGRVHDGASRR